MSHRAAIGMLSGVRVVEMAGLGPVPHAASLLADLGADVIRVDRPPGAQPPRSADVNGRGRRSIAIDLQTERGREVALGLIAASDVVLEGFRPGVMERLGLGPAEVHQANPAVVYGRMTGWGQTGPYAGKAGHDLTYLAVTGALHAVGPAGQPPVPPLNLVGDFGGGSMVLVIGVLAALRKVSQEGEGEVIDAAIVDGVASMLGLFHGFAANGSWTDDRWSNLLDGGAPFYRCYACADGRFIAVAAIEQKFWAELLTALDIDRLDAEMWDRPRHAWPVIGRRLERLFRTRGRDEWVERAVGHDACLAPVLSMTEAAADPHVVSRDIYVDLNGVRHPRGVPRFAKASEAPTHPAPRAGEHSRRILMELGIVDIEDLLNSGVVHASTQRNLI